MTALQNIRTQLKAILKDISGIGNIYPYYRYKKNDWNETLKLFKLGSDFKGVMFRQVSRKDPVDDDNNDITRKWEFTMLRQVNDEQQTALQFEDLIEVVCETFNNENQDLNNSVREHNNLQLIDITEQMIGDVLCHQAVLNLETIESI